MGKVQNKFDRIVRLFIAGQHYELFASSGNKVAHNNACQVENSDGNGGNVRWTAGFNLGKQRFVQVVTKHGAFL